MDKKDRVIKKAKHKIGSRKPFIIDQISFQIPGEMLEVQNLGHYEKSNDEITVRILSGARYYLHFHDKIFDYDIDIISSIYRALEDNMYSDYPIFKNNIRYEDILEHFKLRVIEFAFDFHTRDPLLFVNFSTGSLYTWKEPDGTTTVYSTDYEKGKKKRRSLISYYHRSAKLQKIKTGKPDTRHWINRPGYDNSIYRFEYRLKDPYLSKIDITDLRMTPMGLSRKMKPILIRYTRRVLKPNSLWITSTRDLKILHPYLYEILRKSGQKHISPLSDKRFQRIRKAWRAYKYSN